MTDATAPGGAVGPVGPVVVDPRVRARRIAVRRDEGRRRLRRLIAFGVGVVLVAAGALATRSPLLDVDRIQVAGATHTPDTDVVAAAQIALGAAMTDIDVGQAEVAISALPWVESVDVTRRWPATIRIEISEREPAAVVAAGDVGWLVVDASGRVISSVATRPDELVALEGLGDDDLPAPGEHLGDAGDDLLVVVGQLPADVSGWVVSASAGDRGIELGLGGGSVAVLGSTARLGDKMVALRTLLTDVDLACLDAVDVRVPTAPVLTRVPGCVNVSTQTGG